jgi:hypothetical protein
VWHQPSPLYSIAAETLDANRIAADHLLVGALTTAQKP